MNLDQAIQQDAECKLKLRSAILKHESLDAESIGRADRCVLDAPSTQSRRHVFRAAGSARPCQ